jgi:hypothetical protein
MHFVTGSKESAGLEEYKLRSKEAYKSLPEMPYFLSLILQKEEAILILSCPSKCLLDSRIIQSI